MTVQRQYGLPNCTLVLEGWSSEAPTGQGRAPLSILTNVECHFPERDRWLSGDRDFLTQLAQAASAYAQQCLSGLAHPQAREATVRLEPTEGDGHHRLVRQDGSTEAEPQAIELTTVEVFDLVEAIDQLLADRQTIPELSLQLSPVPRHHRQPERSRAQRAAPAALGVASLAVAAIALSLLPVPPPREREPAPAQGNSLLQPSPGRAALRPPRRS